MPSWRTSKHTPSSDIGPFGLFLKDSLWLASNKDPTIEARGPESLLEHDPSQSGFRQPCTQVPYEYVNWSAAET
jgi:hypothetical protein